MQTLKKLALSAIVTLTLSGIAVGSVVALQPSPTLIADTSGQRGEFDAG
jgi:hypothetical protein